MFEGDIDLEDCLERTSRNPDDFSYLEGSDLDNGKDDAYVEGNMLPEIFESEESRVVSALMTTNSAVNPDTLENLSGVPYAEEVADKLVDVGVVDQNDEGYLVDRDNPEVEELMQFRAQLNNAYSALSERNNYHPR